MLQKARDTASRAGRARRAPEVRRPGPFKVVSGPLGLGLWGPCYTSMQRLGGFFYQCTASSQSLPRETEHLQKTFKSNVSHTHAPREA